MAESVNIVNRAVSPAPYANTRNQTQNAKELFDLLRPMQTDTAGVDGQKVVGKTAQEIIENIKKQFISKDSDLASAGLKKLLDTLSFLNNKAGAPILNDKELQMLMLKPETLLKELNMQQKGASIFTGELFDGLRNILKMKTATPGDKEKLKDAVVNFLRQYANTYLKSPKADMQSAQTQAARQDMAVKQGDMSSAKNTALLQQDKSGQQSVQNENKAGQGAFNRAESLLSKATDKLIETLKDSGPAFDKIRAQMEMTKSDISHMILKQSAESSETQKNTVINNMLDIILNKLDESGGNASIKIYGEQIVRGMLNNNALNQPLMHFLLPIRFEEMDAFAEMWVDPNAENPEAENSGKGKGKSIRMFLTVDLEENGKAEIDVMLTNNKIYTGLFYPQEIADGFKNIKQYIAEVTKEAGYAVGNINVEPLKTEHKLDEIVSKPLERRMSLDAKV